MKAAVWYAKKDVRVMDVPERQACGGMGKGEGSMVRHLRLRPSRIPGWPIFIPTGEHPLTHRKSPLILGHEILRQNCRGRRGCQ